MNSIFCVPIVLIRLYNFIEENIKKRSSIINAVKAYVKDDKLAVNIHVSKDGEYNKIIEDYNMEVPVYEKVSFFEVYIDSIDTRLKQ